jgi:hypothetical protein
MPCPSVVSAVSKAGIFGLPLDVWLLNSMLFSFPFCAYFPSLSVSLPLEPFREPVPWKELGLLDYPSLITEPMDLGTVQKNIQAKKYNSLLDASTHVRLIWRNCMTYNADGSDFYVLAESLHHKWEKQYANLLSSLGLPPEATGESSKNESTLEDKRQFAKMLYKISKEAMGHVVITVDEKSPEAVVRNTAEDECTLNIDKIRTEVFVELKKFVEDEAKKKAAADAKKKKTKS